MTLTAPFPATINVPAGCKPVLQVFVFTSIWLRFQHLPSPVGCIRLSTCFCVPGWIDTCSSASGLKKQKAG